MIRPFRTALLFTLFFSLGISTITASAAKSCDVVITVGTKPIKRAQIDTIVGLMIKAQSANGEVGAEQREMMKKLVATNLIGQELLEMEAKTLHIEASATQVDSVLRSFKSRFPDETTFKKALQEAGDTEAKVKVKLARQIRADKVLASRIKKPEMPTEKEMQAFWEKNKKEFPVNDSLRALQIVLLTNEKTPGDEVAKKRKALESIRQQLMQDSGQTTVMLQRFMSAAAQISEGPEARTGGDLQRFHPRDFNPDFRKQVQGMRVGQLSQVFKTPLGLHLVFLIEKYDGKYESYKLQITQNLVNQKTMVAGGEMRQFLKSLAEKYPVKYLISGYKDSSESGIY